MKSRWRWANRRSQPSAAGVPWLALLVSAAISASVAADDAGALRSLDARSPFVEFVDPGVTPTTARDLEAAFARVLRDLPARAALGVRPEDAAVGRISAVQLDLDERGAPRMAYYDAHGVVLADYGCAFAFATVAHFMFDFGRASERVSRGSLQLVVAGQSFSGEAIRAMLPNEPPPASSNRTLRDIVVLLVTKAPPCQRLPAMPVFARADAWPEAHASTPAQAFLPAPPQGAPWRVFSMCPIAAPQACGLVILPSPDVAQPLPPALAASAMAYHSCTGRRGDSGCPLIAVGADGRHRLLALQTQGVPVAPDGAYIRADELRLASRAAIVGERIDGWLRELAQLAATHLPEQMP